ncbi:MAG: alpha/beta fold hydrolase, partial [Candidatus Limnocylindrales bacterium]
PYDDLAEAESAIRGTAAGWPEGDIRAKALGLTQFDPAAVLAVLLENGDWDGGLSALADPNASGVPVWLIRGDFAAGGMIPDSAVPVFETRIGADHVRTIAGAPHSPQRTFPEATVSAILRALD